MWFVIFYFKGKIMKSSFLNQLFLINIIPCIAIGLISQMALANEPNTEQYITMSNMDCKAYNPMPSPNETATWSGGCVNGYVHGEGRLQWYLDGREGGSYIGNYHQGKMEGQGVFIWKDDVKYIGEFKNNQRDGYGIHTWADGENYAGYWKVNKKHGKGSVFYPSGNIYTGDFEHDKKHGKGKYVFAHGGVYVGDFENDASHGFGVRTYSDGTKYIGMNQHGNPINGKIYWNNGKIDTCKSKQDCINKLGLETP